MPFAFARPCRAARQAASSVVAAALLAVAASASAQSPYAPQPAAVPKAPAVAQSAAATGPAASRPAAASPKPAAASQPIAPAAPQAASRPATAASPAAASRSATASPAAAAVPKAPASPVAASPPPAASRAPGAAPPAAHPTPVAAQAGAASKPAAASPPGAPPIVAPPPAAASRAPLAAPAAVPAAPPAASRPAAVARPVGAHPIFVLNSLDATISVIDPVSMTEQRRIPTGKEPHHLYLTPDEKSLVVANALGDTLTFVDPATGEVQRTLGGIGDPYHLRFSPDMKWFVTAANRLDFVAIYRWQPADAAAPFKLVKRIEAPRTPSHLNIDSRSSVVYASLQDSDELIAIDLATQTTRWKIPVGKLPADLYLTADDRLLFVGLTGDDHVEVYDVSQPRPVLVKRIRTGLGAHAFRARGDRRHVYVSNRVANTVSLIDTQTLSVVESYPAPGGPDCMDVSADGKRLFVTSRWARKLTVIDLEKKQVARQVAVGRSPHGVWTLDHAPRL